MCYNKDERSDTIINIISNEQVSEYLLNKVEEFDQSIFNGDEYTFPKGYLNSVYQSHPEGMFVLLNDEEIIGYVNVLFLSDDTYYNYLKTRDYLTLRNEGIHEGDNNMYFYTLAIKQEYRDQGYARILLESLFNWLNKEILKGRKLKNVICEVISKDGIKPAHLMGFVPLDNEPLGMYYAEDNLKSYMEKLLSDDTQYKRY